ncbi:hypothetical protein FRB93_001394 [Tulasnella sp. JGI-2019a]|nr:hypothetical protein FRB93_001394 [Tulasnella sp. JGI-2019a]
MPSIPQIDSPSISSLHESLVKTFCLPPELDRWFEVDLEDDPCNPTWIAAWDYFARALSGRGYHLFFTRTLRPENPSPTLHSADSFSPPKNPFRPGNDEAFVLAEFPYPPEREFMYRVPTVFPGYDFTHREVIIKALRTESEELPILKTLSSPEVRLHPANHTIPVLDFVLVGGWTLVVMPAWGCVDQFPPLSIGEYLQHAEQDWPSCTISASPMGTSPKTTFFLTIEAALFGLPALFWTDDCSIYASPTLILAWLTGSRGLQKLFPPVIVLSAQAVEQNHLYPLKWQDARRKAASGMLSVQTFIHLPE